MKQKEKDGLRWSSEIRDISRYVKEKMARADLLNGPVLSFSKSVRDTFVTYFRALYAAYNNSRDLSYMHIWLTEHVAAVG